MADRPTERRRLDQMTDDDLDALYDRAERAEQQAAHVRAVLAEVLAQFTHNTHPGRPCKQTGHVNVATIDRWHAALDTAGQDDCPSCEVGIEHDVHCPTPETHNHGCPCTAAPSR